MSESNIRMVRSQKPFTIILNSVLRDKALGLKAKGLYSVMVSLPDDWEYTISGLAALCNVGRDCIRSTLLDLEKAGYLERHQTRPEAGKFGGCEYILYETPDLKSRPLSGFPATDKPATENPTQQNKDIYNNNPPNPPEGGGNTSEKKEKREKRESRYKLEPAAQERLRAYCLGDQELAKLLQGMMAQREKLHAIGSDIAVQQMLSKLDRLSGGDRAVKIALISTAIENSWKTFYPPKDGLQRRPAEAAPAKKEVRKFGPY